MTNRESPEKRTVERTDELLQKSRRLIDELEFILDSLQSDPKEPKDDRRTDGGDQGNTAH